MSLLAERLAQLDPSVFAALNRGIEKESLRTTPQGCLALEPHPAALGSALTHPHITTDFSESQPELVTGVHTTAQGCFDELREIHGFVYRNIGDELLWASSMPCGLPAEERIPLGQYGTSNVARSKTVYREGLSYRYGRRMQTICGIHYNFSLPENAWALLHRDGSARMSEREFRDAGYFSLIRNFRRNSWLLLLLFGASPALCESFLEGQPHGLQVLTPGTLYLPYATSLRMGPLGYQSEAQASMAVSFNSFESYASSLSRGLEVSYPAYERIGVHDGHGGYRQLATTLLQIENEFYGTIRPKRTIRSGERPLVALRERGVQYVEVRLMDLDPFLAAGIEPRTMRFLDLFLLHCLLSDSPPDTPEEGADLAWNQHRVAQSGRHPELRLRRRGTEVALSDWGRALLTELQPLAQAMDEARILRDGASTVGQHPYADALDEARRRLDDLSNTPSARVLESMRSRHGGSFRAFALERSIEHRAEFLRETYPAAALQRQRQMAYESLQEQRRIEAADVMPFETYRQRYLAGTLELGDARAA